MIVAKVVLKAGDELCTLLLTSDELEKVYRLKL